MLSIAPLGAASGGRADYYKTLTKKDDYYQNGGEPPGQWSGAGIHALGINGQITNQQLDRLFRGEHPDTGEALVKGAGDKHRAGWDLTFSAPKSVTAAWAIADPELRDKIQAAQDRASSRAIAFLEEKAAFARRGKAGEEHEKLPGLIVAKYSHSTSRKQDEQGPDPQLHDHCLFLNVAQRADGTWGGIESKHLMEWKMAAGAAYRAELAAEMREIGFRTEKDDSFFKLSGISDRLCDSWSKRRAAIEEKLEETGYTSAAASARAALNTRTAKGEINRADLHERWQSEAAVMSITADTISRLARGGETIENTDADPADEAEQLEKPENIYEKLTWMESVFDEQKLYENVAIEAAHTGGNVDDVQARVQALLDDKEILKLRGEKGETVYTTKSMRALEKGLADDALARKNETNHVVSTEKVDAALAEFAIKKGFSLSLEQQAAVRRVTETAGGIVMVRGAAGAGKSTMAEASRTAWEADGKTVIGCAPSGKAARGLSESAGIQSSTIHRLLRDIEKGRKVVDATTVIVVDEAGMVGSRLMSKLTTAAGEAGAKLVLVGDHKQLQAVEAGSPFRLFQKHLGYAELNEVRRQRDTADRDAAAAIADGRAADAIQSYLDRGRIKIVKPEETEKQDSATAKAATIKELVGDWGTFAFRGGTTTAKHSIQESLIMAGTRADVLLLNEAAREAMKDQHMLCNSHTIQTRNGEREFAENDRVLLGRNDSRLGVKNGELGWIERLEINKTGEITSKIRLDCGELKTIKLAGEGAYTEIDHGYAVTTHKSQGATVDHAYALLGQMNDAELSYVQMSRQRDSVMVYASARTVEDELEKAAASADATPGMLKAMDKIAKEKDIEKAESNDFLSVRDWLDEHSKKRIGHGEQEAKEAEEPGPERDLKDLISLMSRSHQKVTSMDYEIVETVQDAQEPEPAPEPAPEPTPAQQQQQQEQALALAYEYEAE